MSPATRGYYEQLLQRAVASLARHFGLPMAPRVRVGCDGCPFYDARTDTCVLGYIACYDPETNTITVKSPEYIREEVILHELLHFVVANLDRLAAYRHMVGVGGYRRLMVYDKRVGRIVWEEPYEFGEKRAPIALIAPALVLGLVVLRRVRR